jgi:hypothetical protein
MVDKEGEMLRADPILLALILERNHRCILIGVATKDTNQWHSGLDIPFIENKYDNVDIISQHYRDVNE